VNGLSFCLCLHCSDNVLLHLVQESKIDMSELQLKAPQLAEMVSLIEDGTISGKIGKQILPDLLQVCLEAEGLALTNYYTGFAPALDSFSLQR